VEGSENQLFPNQNVNHSRCLVALIYDLLPLDWLHNTPRKHAFLLKLLHDSTRFNIHWTQQLLQFLYHFTIPVKKTTRKWPTHLPFRYKSQQWRVFHLWLFHYWLRIFGLDVTLQTNYIIIHYELRLIILAFVTLVTDGLGFGRIHFLNAFRTQSVHFVIHLYSPFGSLFKSSASDL
jgi:hypothetical protein